MTTTPAKMRKAPIIFCMVIGSLGKLKTSKWPTNIAVSTCPEIVSINVFLGPRLGMRKVIPSIMNALRKPGMNRYRGTLFSLKIGSNCPPMMKSKIDVVRAIAKKIMLVAIGEPICLESALFIGR